MIAPSLRSGEFARLADEAAAVTDAALREQAGGWQQAEVVPISGPVVDAHSR